MSYRKFTLPVCVRASVSRNGSRFQLLRAAILDLDSVMQRGTDGLDRAPAQGAGGVPEQPAVDARQVERVAAHRQAPRAVAGFELLRRQRSSKETR